MLTRHFPHLLLLALTLAIDNSDVHTVSRLDRVASSSSLSSDDDVHENTNNYKSNGRYKKSISSNNNNANDDDFYSEISPNSSNGGYGDYEVYGPGSGGTGTSQLDYESSGNKGTIGASGSSSSSGTFENGYYSSSFSSKTPSKSSSFSWRHSSLQLPLIPVILILILTPLLGMLLTAHQLLYSPEGTCANCCRLSLSTLGCTFKVLYNLYHCRLADIPQIMCSSELDEEDEINDNDERIKLRPGIERALHVEHRKAMRRVMQMEMGKVAIPRGIGGEG